MRGRHSAKFGVDVRREHMVIAFVNRPNGDFSFTGVHTGSAAADFLLGRPAQFRRTTSNTIQDGSGWLYAAYAQDEVRAGRGLTVSYGFRYELPQPFVDRNDALNAFRPGVQSQRFPQAPAGLVYPGDPGMPRGTYPTDKNNLAPRLGVVWDPAGTGRSSLRGAWGLFYDALAGQGDFFQNGVLAPPFTPLLEVNAPPAVLSLRDPMSAVSGGAPGFPPGLIFIGWGEDFTTPYAHHFNLTWQQQIGGHLGAEAGYVGSRGRHLPIFMEVNPGVHAPGQVTRGARLFPAFSLVRPTFSVAESWYDSLQASLRMRPRRGVSFLASYTLGEARDHVSGLNIGGEQRPPLPVTIGDDASITRALDDLKGPAQFDVRHRFVVSFAAELPTPRAMGALLEHLAGGWQLNGIVQWQTGFPMTVSDSNRKHPLPHEPSGPDLRPERERAAHGRAVVQHGMLRPPGARRHRRAGNHAAQQRAWTGPFAHRPVALQEHPNRRDAPAAAAGGSLQPVQPGTVQQPEHDDRQRELRTNHERGRRACDAIGCEVQLLSARGRAGGGVEPAA